MASKGVACADFVSDVYIKSGAKVFDNPGWDMQFAVLGEYVSQVFGGCVDVREVVFGEICKFVMNVCS